MKLFHPADIPPPWRVVCLGSVWGSCLTAARNWSSLPTTKLSPARGDLIPFCVPTTDMEQPLCSRFPGESRFPTLSSTIGVPARREEEAFCSRRRSGPSRVTPREKGITGMSLGGQLRALNLLEEGVSRFREHFPIGKAGRTRPLGARPGLPARPLLLAVISFPNRSLLTKPRSREAQGREESSWGGRVGK